MKHNQDPKVYYRHLTNRMMLTMILVSFTPMFLVGGVIYDQFHYSYRQKVHDHLRELIQKHRQNIDVFLKEKRSDIRFLASSGTPEDFASEAFLRGKLNQLQQGYGTVFEDLGLVRGDGLQVAYAGPFKLDKANYQDAKWFPAALQNEYYISDVFLGLRGYPHFIITARRIEGETTWILRATINFMAFNSLVENIRIGKTGFAFIVNTAGEFQTEPAFDAVPDMRRYTADFLAGGASTRDGIHIVEKPGDDGHKNIFVGAYLKDGDWLMIYQQHASDAFADLHQAQRMAIFIMVVGGFCILAMAMFLSRWMVGKIARADREKEMMNQQVIETGKLASIGQLAAGIAHEINNPVAIMVEEAGWIDDLLMEEDLKEAKNLEEFKRALKQINTQGRRCKEITHKLLSFARKTDTRLEKVQINDLIEELVELSAQRSRYSNVHVQLNLDRRLPEISVSQTEMQQVLLNLINNAMDAMEREGGSLEITTSRSGKNLQIEVADNGPGIPRANIARIFDPFFTTKPVGKGTGLGLSICYGIIKKMGGEIDVKSVLDMGSTFWVRIPLEDALSPEKDRADEKQGRGKTRTMKNQNDEKPDR